MLRSTDLAGLAQVLVFLLCHLVVLVPNDDFVFLLTVFICLRVVATGLSVAATLLHGVVVLDRSFFYS